jgi:hypothetical protein
VNPIRPLSHLSRGASLEDEGVQHFKGSVASKPIRIAKWKRRWFSGSERDRALPDSEVTPDSLDHVQAIRIQSGSNQDPFTEIRLKLLCGHFSSSSNHVSWQSHLTRMSPLSNRIERANHGAVRRLSCVRL